MITHWIDLPAAGAGTSHRLAVHRFGQPGSRPSVYIQAALHADEIPGMLCAVELRRALIALEAVDGIRGEIVLVPVANPIGLAQDVLGTAIGRFHLADGGNFNRGFPALGTTLVERVAPRLGPDLDANAALVRAELAALLAEHPATGAAAALKSTLMRLALPCDLVLDLHCDADAVVHLYTHSGSAGTFAPLAARLGCEAFLVADISGGDPFDEAVSRPWFELAAAVPERPVPPGCQSVTVELRGQRDVAEALARRDAAAIVGFLQDVGIVDGDPPPVPQALCRPTPLAASEPLLAPVGGILVYRFDIGESVLAGETVAEIVDPLTGVATRVPSPCDGRLFARTDVRFVAAGRRLGKVAGTQGRRSGPLLSP
jgi:hypothetical protein